MARRAAASKDAEGGACPPQTTFQWWSRPQAQAGPGPVLGTPAPAVAMKGVVQSEEAVDASGAVVAGVHVTKESCPCSAAGAAGKCIKLKPDPLDRPAAVALLTVARRFGFRLVTSGIGDRAATGSSAPCRPRPSPPLPPPRPPSRPTPALPSPPLAPPSPPLPFPPSPPPGTLKPSGPRASSWAPLTRPGRYFLMLVAMTYNAALFCSIIAGFAFGSIAFGWIPEWSCARF
eukprot:tig00021525_g22129.t1